MQRHYTLLNLLIFKFSWALLVWGQNSGLLPALFLLLASITLHPAPRGALRKAGAVALIGIALDQILSWAGIFIFETNHLPLWLLVLWLHFGMVLPEGFRFLFGLPLWLQVGAGACAGPLGYWAGMQLGAVSFGPATSITLLILAAAWGVFLPLVMRIAQFSTSAPGGKLAGGMLLVLFAASSYHPDVQASESISLLGRAMYRAMFMDIYEASLASGSTDFKFQQTVPFELSLTYKRKFRKKSLLNETLRQWRLQGVEPQAEWVSHLEAILPDVSAGDSLALFVDSSYASHFRFNGNPIGVVTDPAFSKAFAGIWLADNTTHPEFRQQLLRGSP